MPRLKDKGVVTRTHFQTPRDSVHEEFLNPCLNCAQLYQQKTAFLSTETFRLLRRGLAGLLRNKGRLQLIISDRLENNELQALVEGYARKQEPIPQSVIENCAQEFRNRMVKLLDSAEPNDLQGYEILASLVEIGAVQVRIALANTAGGLFHSKKGIITDSFGDYVVFTGSPNFTAAGLKTNYEEVDIIAKSWETDAGKEHIENFNALWSGESNSGYYTVAFEKKFIEIISTHPRIKRVSEITPLDARIRGLEEAFRVLRTGESLSAKYNYVKLAEARFNFLPLQPKADLSLLELFPHQIEGAKQLVARIQKFGTALLGDSVGLGKTRTAGVAIRLAREQGLVKKVLILAPRKLHSQWDEELREVRIDRSDYRIMSKDQFLRWPHEKMELEARPYDFIIVDEAHQGLRNHRAKGWQNLTKLPQKNGLLITATPWNNSRDDLYNLFSLFCRENTFEGLFAPGQRKRSRRVFEENDSLYKTVWHQLCIQRTRRMIPDLGKMYPDRVPQADQVPYSPEQTASFITLSERISRLKMPYFNLLQFINPELELSELASFRHKLLLFKRAESSFFAFRRTLERFQLKTDLFRDAVREASSPDSFRSFLQKWAVNRNFLVEGEDDDPSLWEDLDETEASRLEKVNDAVDELTDAQLMTCRSALDAALTEDSFELGRVLREFPRDGDAGKWELVEKLISKHRDANQKVIVVSQFVDTALYVYDKLFPRMKDQGVGLVTGQENLEDHPMAKLGGGVLANGIPKQRDEVLSLFAPISKKRDAKGITGSELNVLVGSDTISVGQNLQDATVLINLDLPYNPMILEQRIGRIDRPRSGERLGSIYIHYFYNHRIIESETNLRRILEGKIRSILKDVNFDSVLLPGYEDLINRIKTESPQTVLDLLADIRDAAPEWSQEDLALLLEEDGPNFSEADKASLQRLRSGFDPDLVKHDEPVVGTNAFSPEGSVLVAADLEVTFFDEGGKTLSSRFVPVVLSKEGKLLRSLSETEKAMQPRSIIGTNIGLNITTIWEALRKLDNTVIAEVDAWKNDFQSAVEKRVALTLQKQAAQRVNVGPIIQYIDHVANDDRLYRQHVGENAEIDTMVGSVRNDLPNAPQDDQKMLALLKELRDKPDSLWKRLPELHQLLSNSKSARAGRSSNTTDEAKHYTSVKDIQIRVVNLQLMREAGR